MRKYPTLVVLLVALLALLVMGACNRRAKTDSAAAGSAAPGVAAPVLSAVTSEPSIEIDRADWPVIVAFGDSLTFGQGVPFERNYPSLLQEELDLQGYKYRVVNAGISGETTTGGLNRIEMVLSHQPQIVILELGANDGLRGQSTERMQANLAAIIERLQEEQVRVILAGMRIPPNYGPEHTQAFRQVFVDLAAKYGLPLIPFLLDGVAARPELNQPDGIHPTADGYRYVVQNVLQVLGPLLTP